ncbi:MAG: O-methyltransferase [Thermoplasmata archaeon]
MFPEEHPDVDWVRALADTSSPRAAGAVREAAAERSLFRHLSAEHRKERRPFYVEIEAPLELYALARLLRPRHIVEVGVSSGVSSAYFLQALEKNGHGTLHSVELPKLEAAGRRRSGRRFGSWSIPRGRFSGWAVPLGLRKRWDLRIGDKKKVLPLLAEELDEVDLFLYDVPHSDPAAFREFSTLGRRLRPGSVALVDHGGTEEICPSLRRWARSRKAVPSLRRGLGLAAFRQG